MTWPSGSLAPQLLPVREGVSRYVFLPVFDRCTHCGAPIGPLEQWSISRDYLRPGDPPHTGLCQACGLRLSDGSLRE